MRRNKLFCSIMVCMLAFILVACGGNSQTPGQEGDKAAEVTYLSFGTGGVAGTFYPVGGVIASAMSKSGVVSVTAQTSAASLENIRLAGSGERQLGLAVSGLLLYAQQGEEMFTGEQYPELAALANMMFQDCQFLVRADSGINSIKDMAGKVVGTGAPGSGESVFAKGMLEAIGVWDQVRPMELSYSEQTTAFKDRQLDVMFLVAPAPTASIMDAASQANIKMIPVDGEEREKVINNLPYFVPSAITPEQYSFLTEDINTVGCYSTMFTTTDIPEDLIYEAMKAMFGELDTLQNSHSTMADFTPETALIGLPIDLHPGAKKYYEEIGVLN